MKEVFHTAGTLLGRSERKPVDHVALARVYAGWNWFHRKVREEGRHPVLYIHLLGRKPREGAALPGGNAEDVRAAPASRPPTWGQPNPGRVATTGPAAGRGWESPNGARVTRGRQVCSFQST